jgi:putative FmdB family regulatory protein
LATYAYVCQGCGHEFEVTRPMSEREQLNRDPPACPSCGKRDVRDKPSMFTAIRDWRTT